MKFINVIFGLLLVFCSAVVFAQAIDINTATAKQLEKGLKGIGPKKAAEIVKYREANGPFKSVGDLTKVSGVGAKTLAANKDMLMVGGVSPMPAAPKAPEMPATPKVPEMPKAATMPAAPKAPEMPATPKVPEMPKAATMPAAPAEPAKQ